MIWCENSISPLSKNEQFDLFRNEEVFFFRDIKPIRRHSMQLIIIFFLEVVFFPIWGLTTCFLSLLYLNQLYRSFRRRKPSKKSAKLVAQKIAKLVALANDLGVSVSVGTDELKDTNFTNIPKYVGGFYSPQHLAIWCREYREDVLWHELTHALQHYVELLAELDPEEQSFNVDAAGLRSLLQENGIRCTLLPIFIFAFNIKFFFLVKKGLYKPQDYKYELLAYFCQYTRAGKKLVYRKIASL
jgi:hypothetical protein